MSDRDPYVQDSGALRNRLGLTEPEDVQLAELLYSRTRLAELSEGQGPRGHFDLAHLKALHHHLFQDVYAWAGTTRGERTTIEGESFTPPPFLSKNETLFALAPQVVPYLNDVFSQLANDNDLRGLNRADFAEKAADLFSDINSAHGFREGNGRTQRAFMTELSVQAGHRLDFSVVSQERMIQASVAGTNGDNAQLRRMFEEIGDPQRVRMLQEAIERVGKMGMDWNERYLATTSPGHPYDGQLAFVGAQTFIMAGDGQTIVGQRRDVGWDAKAEDRVQFVASPHQEMGLDLEL